MIKFFRKVRKSLLSENKPSSPAGRFSKYLIYAGGEIVLVVIGILIALQINTWNEERKSAANEAHILTEILNNLEEDKAQIIYILGRRNKAQDAVEKMLSILNESPIDEKGIEENIAYFLSFERFYPLNNSFEMMKANGLIIENKNLRTLISRYFDFEQKKVSQSIEDIEQVFLRIIRSDNAIRSNLGSAGLGTNETAHIELKDSNKAEFLELLETELIAFVDNNGTGIERIAEFRDQNENLIKLIKEELITTRLKKHL